MIFFIFHLRLLAFLMLYLWLVCWLDHVAGQLFDTEVKKRLRFTGRHGEAEIDSFLSLSRVDKLIEIGVIILPLPPGRKVTTPKQVLQIFAGNHKGFIDSEFAFLSIIFFLVFNVEQWGFFVHNAVITCPEVFVHASDGCYVVLRVHFGFWTRTGIMFALRIASLLFASTVRPWLSFNITVFDIAALCILQVHQFIASLPGNQPWILDKAGRFRLQNEMAIINIFIIFSQEDITLYSQVEILPVRVGETIDKGKHIAIFDPEIPWFVLSVILGRDSHSLGPEFHNDELPGLLQVHPPQWSPTFLVNWD